MKNLADSVLPLHKYPALPSPSSSSSLSSVNLPRILPNLPSHPDHTTRPISTSRRSVDSLGQEAPTAVNTPRATSPSTAENGGHDLRQQGPTAALETEMGLKEKIRLRGDVVNVPEGIERRSEVVDLGHGMEEVVVVEWLPGDPEVRSRTPHVVS